MMKSLSLFIGLASALAAQTIREARLDPKQAVDLPVFSPFWKHKK